MEFGLIAPLLTLPAVITSNCDRLIRTLAVGYKGSTPRRHPKTARAEARNMLRGKLLGCRLALTALGIFLPSLLCYPYTGPQQRTASLARTGPRHINARIVRGPEILVSRDEDFAHVETMLLANPADPQHLLASCIIMPKDDEGVETASHDCPAGSNLALPGQGHAAWKIKAFPLLLLSTLDAQAAHDLKPELFTLRRLRESE